MKIISKYVLREHSGPLVFALSALTSLMLLNYIAKQLGNLVGKGLSWTVILEFFVLSLPFTVAMTLPMAVLVSVLYAFSRLAAENEVTALKASGVSMVRLLIPVLIGGAMLSLVMIIFNDQILPRTNHRLRTLQADIARKKPTFALKEQIINEVAPGRFFLRTNHLNRATNLLREVTIYDLSEPLRRRTIYADSGLMAFTPSGADLQLTLYDGYMQEVPTETRTQLRRTYYGVDLIRVPGVANAFERDSTDSYKSDREMSVCELQNEVARYERDYFHAYDEYKIASTAVQKNASATVDLGTSGRPLYMPGGRAPRSRQRSFGRAYCDALLYLEKRGLGNLTMLAMRGAVSMVEPRTAGAQQAQARDTLKTRADTLRARADSVRRDSVQRAQRGSARLDSVRRDSVRRDSVRRDSVRRDSVRRDSVQRDSLQRSDSLRRDSIAKAGGATPPLPPNAAQPAPTLPPGVTVVNGDTIYPGNPSPNPSALLPPNGIGPDTMSPMPSMTPTIPASVAMETARAGMLQAKVQMNQYAVEIQKKFAISLACIVFVLLGAPIALRFPRGGVGLTIGVSLIVFSLYYVGLIAGEALGDRTILSPFWAMQAANILFTIVGLILLARMGREGATSRGGDITELVETITGLGRYIGLGRKERIA